MDTSYLTTQVTTIIAQLHGLFDEIGVPSHERESRETELFTALSETLNNQLKLVNAEKGALTEDANRLIKTIKQMETSLEDKATSSSYELERDDLKVTLPLMHCLESLKIKHNSIAKVHRERLEQVQKLVEALTSYSSHLEPSFVKIPLPPSSTNVSVPPSFDLSPSYIASLDKEFSRVYEEYSKRIENVRTIAEDIVNLWAELGTPQAQTEASIVKNYRTAPEQLGLHQDDIKRLLTKRERLHEEKRGRERRLKELRALIEGLWDRLGIEENDRKRFLAANRGCGLRAINEFEAELDRLNELKRQNLHLFVEDARYKLQELWDGLYFSEEEMLDFAPAFSDVYSDALLSAHEAEISRLEALKEQRAPTLQLVDRHRELVKERDDLAASSQDASRLLMKPNKGEKRDPTRLLREEKMRKRIAKELPKVEADLKKVLQNWEDDYGRPFLVHGVPYVEELAATAAKSLPPRSKTPSAGPTYASTTKQVPLKPAPAPSASRAGSVAASTRGGGLGHSRSATATPATSTLRRNAPPSAASTNGNKTPSKIPARVPLGASRNGGNSPERRNAEAPKASYNTNTVRSMGPPARAPPPKMRELFEPPSKPRPLSDEGHRCESAASSESGRVRHISPEDVYDDRERMSYVDHSMMYPSNPTYHSYDYRYDARQPIAPTDNRQISVTSTSNTATSGSENWETFDDASEPEIDASNAYYAKLRAAKGGKRFTPEGGYTPPGKKFRSAYESAAHPHTVMEDEGGRRMVTGSESAWTDEDAF